MNSDFLKYIYYGNTPFSPFFHLFIPKKYKSVVVIVVIVE